MDVLLRKSPFCPELTQILDLEEIKTHYGKSSNEVIWSRKFSNSVHGVKSAKLTIILDLEETETHYGKSFIMAHS